MKEARRKRRAWIIGISVLLACAFALALYSHYLSGTIRLDSEWVSEENLEALAEGWRELAESGRYVPWSAGSDFPEGVHALAYLPPDEAESEPPAVFFLIIMAEDWAGTLDEVLEDGRPEAYARYRRVSLSSAMHGLGTFGECTSHIAVSSDHCAIYSMFWETDGTARGFHALLSEALEIVGAG